MRLHGAVPLALIGSGLKPVRPASKRLTAYAAPDVESSATARTKTFAALAAVPAGRAANSLNFSCRQRTTPPPPSPALAWTLFRRLKHNWLIVRYRGDYSTWL